MIHKQVFILYWSRIRSLFNNSDNILARSRWFLRFLVLGFFNNPFFPFRRTDFNLYPKRCLETSLCAQILRIPGLCGDGRLDGRIIRFRSACAELRDFNQPFNDISMDHSFWRFKYCYFDTYALRVIDQYCGRVWS